MPNCAIAGVVALVACSGTSWPPRAHDAAQSLQVIAATPGLSSDEVERYVTIPLEVGLAGMPGLVATHSTSEADQARVVVELTTRDTFAARSEIIERLQHVQLPSGIQAELGVSSQQRVAVRFVVRGPAMAARTFADWHVQRALRTIAGVADVDTRGGEVEQLRVAIDPARLAASGLAATDVATAIANAGFGAGLEVGPRVGMIRATGSLHGVIDVAAIVVGSHAGTSVQVGDVATVASAAAPRDCAVTDARGDDLVEGVVWTGFGADVDEVRAAARDKLVELARQLPPGLTLEPLEPVELARETAIALPPGEPAAWFAGARAVSAALGSGDAVVEACRPLVAERDVPDEIVVRSSQPIDALAGVAGAAIVPAGPAIWVRVVGADEAELSRVAAAVVAASAAIPEVAVTERVGTATVPHVVITPDRKALARFGLNTADLARTIEMLEGGATVAQAYDADRMIDIVVALPVQPGDAAMRDVTLPTPDGARVPIGELAAIERAAAPRAILRANGERFVAVRVTVADDDRRGELRRAIEGVAVPAGYRVEVVESVSPAGRR